MYSLVKLTPADWPRLNALFTQVFGHSLESSLADYKYEQGRGESLALTGNDGEILAHCGMIFRKLLVGGGAVPGVQFGDLMVAPHIRGILSRQGQPFYQVFSGALSRVNQILLKPLVFGFPSDRATRLGERLGLVTKFEQVIELTWTKSQSPLLAKVQLQTERRFRGVVGALWVKMAKDFSTAVIGVRDAEYIDRRYFHHPVHQYHVYVMRSKWIKRPKGIFVLRRQGAKVELVDWIAPLGEAAAVIDQARSATAQLGGEHLTTWLAQSYSQRVMDTPLHSQQLNISVSLGGEISMEWFEKYKGKMWITPGDTDYH